MGAPSIRRCHALDRDADLPVARDEQAGEGGQFGDELQVVDEEREITHGEGAHAHGLAGQDQDDAGAQVDGVAEDGVAGSR